jgi:hypothetical protein
VSVLVLQFCKQALLSNKYFNFVLLHGPGAEHNEKSYPEDFSVQCNDIDVFVGLAKAESISARSFDSVVYWLKC